jgi:hypothetical protein
MMASLILLVLGILFLLAAGLKLARDGWMHPRCRAWFIVGTIFVIVGGSLVLTLRT